MDKPIIGLDHVVIGVRDLDGARADYARLGFVPAPRGDHQGKATSNHCLMFADTYLELLGALRPELEDPGDLKGSLERRGEGLQRLALGTADADAAKAELAAAGLHPDGPYDLARPSADPPGIVRFRNLLLPPEDTGGLRMFLCGHKTPELMRRPDWLDHPNGAVAFVGITAVVADAAPIAAALRRVFGDAAVSQTAYGCMAETGRGRIAVTTADAFARLHDGAAAPPPPLPVWHGLQVAVTSLDATADYLTLQGVPFTPCDAGLRIEPAHARGVLLEFVPA